MRHGIGGADRDTNRCEGNQGLWPDYGVGLKTGGTLAASSRHGVFSDGLPIVTGKCPIGLLALAGFQAQPGQSGQGLSPAGLLLVRWPFCGNPVPQHE